MSQLKELSNPFSTGGGGGHFEAHVQASFVTLMLTGGHAPCLPCWPITEIKLQGKIDGFNTDDIIVFVQDPNNKERRKLLGQIKHSIEITKRSALFGEVIQAAWSDFNNPRVFTKNKDMIALITGPLSKTGADSVKWLLNQAKYTKNPDEFFRKVEKANFSSSTKRDKLKAIQHHLKAANNGNAISDDDFYDFLKHFHLLGYDLGSEVGVVLSLLHSHISQFHQQSPRSLWSRVVDTVQTWNQNAGTITLDNLPEDLLEAFEKKAVVEMPEELKIISEKTKTDWTQHSDATYLALVVLIGGWQDQNPCDIEAVAKLLNISYDDWLNKAREILHDSGSPLSLKNGIWKVANRTELWSLLGSRILDQNLDTFTELAISILKEPDPAFELPAEKRYMASIQGKTLKYSHALRKGIAESLAILGSQPESCRNCSQEAAKTTCILVIRELLTDAGWVLWGSLSRLLPALAEAAPDEFLKAVEKALYLPSCPFDALFSQEGKGLTGRNYLTGLLWALEGLAWDEQYLVRVCVALAELASHDPGGQWANRPFHSLTTILLPWLPQTLASAEKRKVAVQTVLNEQPEIAWKLLIQLLPNQNQTSFKSHKPSWRKTIPHDWEKGVSHHEYWQQAGFCAELAVTVAKNDTARLTALIDHFDKLPETAFEQLLQVLSSQTILELPEEQRLTIWEHLTKFSHKHRRFFDSGWALSDELIARIEQAAEPLAPTNPFNLYQHLFTDRDFDLYEENDNWEEQRKKLDKRREAAISEIFQQDGITGVIRFVESVSSPSRVGYALGVIPDPIIERTLLPHFLDVAESKRKALTSSFIWRRYHLKGWKWCDGIDKSDWTPDQIAQFLAYLPFTKEAWVRTSEWLQAQESKYWTLTDANAYQADGDMTLAIDKLIEHGRPHAAISCLDRMRYLKQPIDTNQCIRALLAAVSSNERSYAMDSIVKIIKFLQAEPSVNEEELIRVEWAYVSLRNDYDFTPQLLESRLTHNPEFFSEVIQLIYRSQKENQPPQEPTKKSKALAENAWRLLNEWKTPPGTQRDRTFSKEQFTKWLKEVKEICLESGHLEVAFTEIGEVLIHTPPDPDGLWIHRAVAAELNEREADALRDGFMTGIYNSRGVYCIDPTGKPEKELAEQFRRKADEVENASFQRFAGTLRNLADSYDHQAERIRRAATEQGEPQ